LSDDQQQELHRKAHMHGGMAYNEEAYTYDPEGNYLKNIKKPNDLNEIIAQTKEVLQKIVSNILSGNIAIEPTKDACTFCKLKEICRHRGGYREPETLIGKNVNTEEVEA
jgi:ATP-dependent helicase/DNAse subunit B